VSWNTRGEVAAALRSLARHGGGRRVVVVDNASTDGTAELVSSGFPHVELIRSEANLGFAAGANRLIEATRPEDLLLLNADVEVTEGALEALDRALASHPRAAVVGPRLVGSDGGREHSAYRFPTLGVASWVNSGLWQVRSRSWRARRLLPGAPQPEVPSRVDWVVGAAMALRRAALEEVGPFDGSFFMYAEDLDWCHRASGAGWEVWVEPRATVMHLRNRSGAQAFGDDQPAAWLESTYRFTRRTKGTAWTAAYFALNAAGAGARYLAARARRMVAPSDEARSAVGRWAPYVRYHFRGDRPIERRRG